MGTIASSIAKDGKEAVTTTALLFTQVGQLTVAVRTLYRLSQQFPVIARGLKAIGQELMKFAPAKKVVDSVGDSLKKLAKSDGAKNVAAAIAAPTVVKGLLLIAGAAAIAAAAIAKFFLNRAKAAAGVKDMANLVDITTKLAQALKLAAEAARLKPDALVNALSSIQEAQAKAFTGSDKQIDAFKRLGFSMEELKRMSPHEIFQRISREVQSGKITNLAALIAILGDDARTLIPAMKNGVAGLSDEFQKLAINRNVLDTLDEADQKIQKAWTSAKSFGALLGSASAAGVMSLVKNVVDIVNFQYQSMVDLQAAQDNFADPEAQRILADDNNYAASKEKTSELEGKLKQKQLIKAAEAEELKAIQEKNAEREREVRLSKMTAEQRIRALNTEKAALQTQQASSKNALEREKLQSKILEIDGELARNQGKEKTGDGAGQARQVDSLTRIGLFRGSSPNAMINAARQQMAIQQRHLDYAARQTVALNKAVSELQNIDRMLREES